MVESILISAGGTGGGVYPAVAVAEALHQIAPERPIHFAGSVGGMERDLVPRALFTSYNEVLSGPLNGVGVPRAALSAVKLSIGIVQAWRMIGRIQPGVLFLTGGWATFPTALAAWLCRVPVTMFLPDIEPALAIKMLSRIAPLVMATAAQSIGYFPPGVTVVETGYPLRDEVLRAKRRDALPRYDLQAGRKTVLVFGGSRGARSINTALATILPDLLADGLQVLHITGALDWRAVKEREQALPSETRSRYHAYSYLHSEDMGLALAAADLAVSRGGASALGEFPFFGLPAIIVPYPFAWRYQKVNADWLAQRGAAVRVNDESMPIDLLPAIRDLLGNPAKLTNMRRASAALAHPESAADIARRLIELA